MTPLMRTWAIVASGPHSALPHHHSGSRRIEDDDVVLLDLGAFHEGYGSDITRTFFIGEPDPEARRVYAVVNEARAAGQAAARDGAIPEEVDRAARAVIERAGYGEAFTHRLGHGVGLEVHELPTLRPESDSVLVPGNVVTVEPGLYLPGEVGVRIEDMVVVTEDGCEPLTTVTKEPVQVG